MGFRIRQILLAVLTANALRPIPGLRVGIPSFFAGSLTTELAPHLLVVDALDTGRTMWRGRAEPLDVALAAATLGGLGLLVKNAYGVGGLVEDALHDGIGADYGRALEAIPATRDLATPWRAVARPFRMHDQHVERIADINYTAGGVRARLDIYRRLDGPVEGRVKGSVEGAPLTGAPVLVQVHGGAWMIGRKEEQGKLLMNRMAAQGWVCVAVNYRLAPKHRWPTQIVDVKKAIAWVREHIDEYGGDPAYVVVTGGSAGGHLAALTALTPGDPEFQPGFEDADTSVAGCVPFYGVYDLAGITGTRPAKGMRDGFLGSRVFPRSFADDPDLFERASPIARITPQAPDFFVLHGEKDTVIPVEQARAFVAKLREVSGATVSFAELPGAQHGFEIFSSIRSQHAVRAVARWLEWHRATHPPQVVRADPERHPSLRESENGFHH